jgi:hypothetical protein
LEPHAVPAVTLPVPSTQVWAPVLHEMTPFLHVDGLPLHALPEVQLTQLPLPLQTMFVPHAVPPILGVLSTQVCTPVVHEVTPFRQAAPGFVVHGWPLAQIVHWPAALQTELAPQLVPGPLAAPSTQVWTPVAHDEIPA